MWVERNGDTWRIRDKVAGRKVDLAAGYQTKTAARTAMILLKADLLRGDALLPRGGQITLNAWLDEWWPSYERSLKPTSAHSESGRVRNHIRPLLGDFALDEIDAGAVQDWSDDLAAGVGDWLSRRGQRRALSPKTIHNCHGLLFTIMHAAVVGRRIRVNPCVGTNLPKREHHEMRFLTDPEIGRLIAATPKHWQPLVLLLVATGLRWAEAIGLKVGRVDLLASKPRLVVVEQLQEMPSTGELIFMSPKSARSRRAVSFPRSVALVLTSLVATKGDDEVVFTTAKGLMVRTRNFRRIWLTACKAAGLEGLRVHDLRHTHAAMLIAANRPLSAISRRLGHSSIAVTDALYGHIREEVDDGILAAVDEALRDVRIEDLEAELADELADDLRGQVGESEGNQRQRSATDGNV